MSRLPAASIGLILGLLANLASAMGETVSLSYEIKLGGFTAGILRLRVEYDEATYRIAAHSESRGLIDALIGFRSDAQTQGSRRGAALQPLAHAADNRWRGEARWVRINYESAGEVDFAAHPPAEQDDREAVPSALAAATLDPLSAALRAAFAAQAGSPCEGRLDVFDGRRRYALHFEARQREGEALRCRVRLERIAGMSHDPWLPILRPIETAELWIGPPAPDLPPTPLRLEAETGLGAAVVRLVELNGSPP